MPVRSVIAALAALSTSCLPFVQAQPSEPHVSFEKLAAECAPAIHPATLKAVVSTESSWNPYAIGVVGGRLERQPRSLAEAVATARALERQGFNFSMGLGQVNRYNLPKYGETYETVFEPCRNLKAGGAILNACFQRAKKTMGDEQSALRAAFSCYYSGNFTRGFRADKVGQPSYVQKVVANADVQVPPIPVVPAIRPQGADGAVAVRPAARATGRPGASIKPVEAPAPWVIFALSAQQETPATQADVATVKEAPAKARRGAPSPEQAPTTGNSQTVPVQLVAPSSNPQETPFVQFVD